MFITSIAMHGPCAIICVTKYRRLLVLVAAAALFFLYYCNGIEPSDVYYRLFNYHTDTRAIAL